MTLETESAHVAEIAFAAALGDRDDVIGIPQRFAAFQTPGRSGLQPSGAAKTADVRVFGDAVGATQSTNAFVAFENAFAQMSRIATQTPFFNAEGGAEGVAAGWDFELAPTAKTAAVRAFAQNAFIGPTALR